MKKGFISIFILSITCNVSHCMRITKRIHFTPHAVKRMDERGISRGEVEKAIKKGTRIVKQDGSRVYTRKNLIVITDPESKMVITVYKNENITMEQSDKERTIKREKEREEKSNKGSSTLL